MALSKRNDTTLPKTREPALSEKFTREIFEESNLGVSCMSDQLSPREKKSVCVHDRQKGEGLPTGDWDKFLNRLDSAMEQIDLRL